MNRASNKILTAGVARVDITPPVGFRLQGIIRRVEPSVSVHMPLFATGIVLSDEQTKIAIFDCDLIGLDICLNIMNVLYDGFNDKKYKPSKLLSDMVSSGTLGKKTGEGFYKY